jgi:hypothetical protein
MIKITKMIKIPNLNFSLLGQIVQVPDNYHSSLKNFSLLSISLGTKQGS